MLERKSALVDALQSGSRNGTTGQRRLRIGETRGWNLLQVASFSATLEELEQAVRPLLGGDLPTRLGKAISVNGRRLLKTGPEQFWIITRASEDLTTAFEAAVTQDIGTVTPLSHSRTCIFVEGLSARELLATGIALDLHPNAFQLDSFALTGLHHTPILIHRSGDNRYDLYVMRTFALWAWEWLTDAALPYGYEIVLPL
ncbi:MAG: sarcosine oxidase subunit gamma family protein [Steroidobacteraceae bacterium]